MGYGLSQKSTMLSPIQPLMTLTAARTKKSFVGVPDVGGELPVAVDLAPDDDVFADDFLRRLGLCLDRDGADFARGGAAQRQPFATNAQSRLWPVSRIARVRSWMITTTTFATLTTILTIIAGRSEK